MGVRSRVSSTESAAIARDVPVLVDAVKPLKPSVTRCVYFTIEAVLASPGWQLELARREIPFLLLGLSGVICQPDAESRAFRTAEQIDALFEAIEGSETFIVAQSELILPTGLLRVEGKAPRRGDVFRVKPQLLQAASLFRAERLTFDEFAREARGIRGAVRRSPGEAKAFREWTENQFEEARSEHQRLERAGQSLEWEDRP